MSDTTPITTDTEDLPTLEEALVYLDALILTLASYPEVQDAPQEDAAA